MTTKEYLEQYWTLNLLINAKMERARLWRQRAEYVSPSGAAGAAGTAGKIRDRVGDIVAKIADLEREINTDIDALVDLGREISDKIKSIGQDKLRQVLELHYLNGLSLDEVAERMHYSYRQICRIHSQALAEITCP